MWLSGHEDVVDAMHTYLHQQVADGEASILRMHIGAVGLLLPGSLSPSFPHAALPLSFAGVVAVTQGPRGIQS